METLKKSLMANFSANIFSASDQPLFPYHSGTEAGIEVPPALEDRGR